MTDKPPPKPAKKNPMLELKNPNHVLPNQSRNPKLGDAVMIGVGNDHQGNIRLETAVVIQVTKAKHQDQRYRFKWELRNDKTKTGWTNVDQRVQSRKQKCDTRVDTHTSFDFVRQCDILSMNKYDIERELFYKLSSTKLKIVHSTTSETKTTSGAPTLCCICNTEIHANDDFKTVHCCFRVHHDRCDFGKFCDTYWKEQVVDETKNVDDVDDVDDTNLGEKKEDGRDSSHCPLCDCSFTFTHEARHAAAVNMSLQGNCLAMYNLAENFQLGFGCDVNADMAEILLRKICSEKNAQRLGRGLAFHSLGLMYSTDTIKTKSIKERRAMCKSLWEKAVALGHTKSLEDLDFHRLVSKERELELDEEEKKQQKRAMIEKRVASAQGKVPVDAWKRGTPRKQDRKGWLQCHEQHALKLYEIPTEDEAPLLFDSIKEKIEQDQQAANAAKAAEEEVRPGQCLNDEHGAGLSLI